MIRDLHDSLHRGHVDLDQAAGLPFGGDQEPVFGHQRDPFEITAAGLEEPRRCAHVTKACGYPGCLLPVRVDLQNGEGPFAGEIETSVLIAGDTLQVQPEHAEGSGWIEADVRYENRGILPKFNPEDGIVVLV